MLSCFNAQYMQALALNPQKVLEPSLQALKSMRAPALNVMKNAWRVTGRHELESSWCEPFLIEFSRCFWWSMFSWNSGPTKSKSVGALAWSEQPMFSSAKLQDFFENLVESSTETTPFSGSYMEKVPLNKGSTTSCFQVQSSMTFLKSW